MLIPKISVKRSLDGKAHIVALSGGKDSTALALHLKEAEPHIQFNYVCTPTGDELPEMFEHWRNLSELLESPIIPVMNGTLASCIADNNALPSWRMRFCTRQLKIEPFIAFLQLHKPAVSYVGLRSDEQSRNGTVLTAYQELASDGQIEYKYPLKESGVNLEGVWAILDRHKVSIPKRTDCAKCFFQRLSEWYELWRDYPTIYQDAVNLEKQYGHTFRSPNRDTWPAPLDELAVEFASGRKIRGYNPNTDSLASKKCRECTL